MSLQRAQSETTSTEFVRWLQYLHQKRNNELKNPSQQFYYLAQIAAVMHATVSKVPISIESKLLKFEFKTGEEMTIEEATRISKKAWGSLFRKKL